MAKTITIELRADDAEPILRKAAYEAAKYSAWCDHLTGKTGNLPVNYARLDTAKAEWQRRFLGAKRIVEAFGIEYEQTSEAETLTISHHHKKVKAGKVVNVGGLRMEVGAEHEVDYSRPYPYYRSAVHSQACHAAADRVVRKWQELITDARMAA